MNIYFNYIIKQKCLKKYTEELNPPLIGLKDRLPLYQEHRTTEYPELEDNNKDKHVQLLTPKRVT